MNNSICNWAFVGKICGDKFYFSEKDFNGLFKHDMNTKKTEFVGYFEGESIDSELLHRNAFLYNDKIFFIPDRGNYVHIYDIKLEKQRKLYVPNNVDSTIYDIFSEENCLYFVRRKPVAIFCVDMVNENITIDESVSEWCDVNIPVEDYIISPRLTHIGGDIYMPIANSNIILKWNMGNKEGQIYRLDVSNIFDIKYIDDFFYISSGDFGNVYKWVPDNKCQKIYGEDELGIKGINHFIKNGNDIIIIPRRIDSFFVKKNEMILKESILCYTEDKTIISMFGFDYDSENIYIFFDIGNGILIIDKNDYVTRWEKLEFENFNLLKKIKIEKFRKKIRGEEIIYEDIDYLLDNYCQVLARL